MRFVRLATKYQEQNILLSECNSKLFLKCSKLIGSKCELRAGYSKEYAEKYHLSELIQVKVDKTMEYSCKKCDKRYVTKEMLQNHLNEHKTKATKVQPVPRTTPTKISDIIPPNKSKDRLNTGAIRMRKAALSKQSKTSGPTVRYACCYCTKVFSKFLNYKKHTHSIHSVNIEHKRVKVDAQHKRLTIEDSETKKDPVKETENDNPNTKKWFVCQTCQQHFLTANKLEVRLFLWKLRCFCWRNWNIDSNRFFRSFQKHQLANCDDKNSMNVHCTICLKNFQTPSALSMHIKTHNSASGICICPFCLQQYQSTIVFKDHVKKHMVDGSYSCPHCTKSFEKYSSIRKHIRINHSTVRFVCHECGKDFKSKYKLKEHSLR